MARVNGHAIDHLDSAGTHCLADQALREPFGHPCHSVDFAAGDLARAVARIRGGLLENRLKLGEYGVEMEVVPDEVEAAVGDWFEFDVARRDRSAETMQKAA